LGCADLAGNVRISFDNVYIEKCSAENPFRERKELKSLFTPKACRVLRVLLQGPLRPRKVVELAEECLAVEPAKVVAAVHESHEVIIPLENGFNERTLRYSSTHDASLTTHPPATAREDRR
jgi:hypothetical protein